MRVDRYKTTRAAERQEEWHKQAFAAPIGSLEARLGHERSRLANLHAKGGKKGLRMAEKVRGTIATLQNRLDDANNSDEVRDFHGDQGQLDRAAAGQYDNAAAITRRGAKQKYYLGNFKTISDHVRSSAHKQAGRQPRQLNAARWTWGLNEAWMEGGVDQNFRFKLKTQLPDTMKAAVAAGGGGDAFLAQAKHHYDGAGDNPFWHTPKKRPTWYSKEMAYLLDNGYRFEELDRANGSGAKKQQFVRGP
jgi:hypothetical protein